MVVNRAVGKCIGTKCRSVAFEIRAGQTGAAIERRGANAGDAVGDDDGGETGAISERLNPDAGNAVGDRDAGQAARVERIVTDADDAAGNGVTSTFPQGILDKRGLTLVEQDSV